MVLKRLRVNSLSTPSVNLWWLNKTAALTISLAAITSVVVVEGVAGLLTNSLAVLSDALHALFDVLATLTLLVATRLSLKPPDETHTYGHGKIESIGGFLGALLLFILGVNIVWSAVGRLAEGEHNVTPELVGFLAIFYTLSIDGLRIFVLRNSLKEYESTTVRVDLFHALSDFSSTLIALVGFASASLNIFVGDTLAALTLCALIFYLSVKTIYRTTLDLSDAIPKGLFNKVRSSIQTYPSVKQFENLKMRKVGDKIFVDVDVAVPQDLSVKEADLIVSDLQKQIQNTVGESEISIRLKPSSQQLSFIERIHYIAERVDGVRGVHKVALTEVGNVQHLTLHIEVDPNLSTDRAHVIAEEVEKRIVSEVGGIGSVTVHIEPTQGYTKAHEIDDKDVAESIKEIAKANTSVKKVNAVMIYGDSKKEYADVRCVLKDNLTVEEAHGVATDIERKIAEKYQRLNVTLHIEAED
jgi:cation diffusion facilitator family transporter